MGQRFADPQGMRNLLLSLLLVAACGTSAAAVRKITYPPDFKYMPEASVRTTMWHLAEQSQRLQAELRQGSDNNERRLAVVRILGEMEKVLSAVDPTGARTNHPMLDNGFDQFRADLEQARQAAEHDPPNYFLAGSVAGSCQYCHAGGGT